MSTREFADNRAIEITRSAALAIEKVLPPHLGFVLVVGEKDWKPSHKYNGTVQVSSWSPIRTNVLFQFLLEKEPDRHFFESSPHRGGTDNGR